MEEQGLSLPPVKVSCYEDNENMWEHLVNLKTKESRKEAK